MKRRRALLFFGGLLVVLAVAATLLKRDLEAAYYVHRLHHAKEWRDRANAAIELGRLKVRRTASDLVKRLQDPSREVRKNCEWALAEVTGWPWGIRDGPAPAWWNLHGKDFVAGRTVPALPRVEIPELTQLGEFLSISAHLEQERVYRLGEMDDMMTVIVTVRNKTDQRLTILRPPWEEYTAYEYHSDGSKTAVDVRPFPPSSVGLTCGRVGRELSGAVSQASEQFSVLPEEIPASASIDLLFQIPVTRDRPGVLFEKYTVEARLLDVVLKGPNGIVTEEGCAPMVTAWAWAGGREVLEHLGLQAQEVAKSGREVLGVAYGRVAVLTNQGSHEAPLQALGWSPLFPPGTLVWAKPCGWMDVCEAAPADGPMLVAREVVSGWTESWILVTDRK